MVHRLVGLVFTLLSWVVGLLGLVEGGLGCWPGDILLMYHRDGDVAPGELVTARLLLPEEEGRLAEDDEDEQSEAAGDWARCKTQRGEAGPMSDPLPGARPGL